MKYWIIIVLHCYMRTGESMPLPWEREPMTLTLNDFEEVLEKKLLQNGELFAEDKDKLQGIRSTLQGNCDDQSVSLLLDPDGTPAAPYSVEGIVTRIYILTVPEDKVEETFCWTLPEAAFCESKLYRPVIRRPLRIHANTLKPTLQPEAGHAFHTPGRQEGLYSQGSFRYSDDNAWDKPIKHALSRSQSRGMTPQEQKDYEMALRLKNDEYAKVHSSPSMKNRQDSFHSTGSFRDNPHGASFQRGDSFVRPESFGERQYSFQRPESFRENPNGASFKKQVSFQYPESFRENDRLPSFSRQDTPPHYPHRPSFHEQGYSSDPSFSKHSRVGHSPSFDRRHSERDYYDEGVMSQQHLDPSHSFSRSDKYPYPSYGKSPNVDSAANLKPITRSMLYITLRHRQNKM